MTNDTLTYLLEMDEPQALLDTLIAMQVCHSDETVVAVNKAGEGNMNLVLRVTTDQRSVIVKQAREWVEKYPSIAAPAERILAEMDFYDRISDVEALKKVMPNVIATNPEHRILVLEDLGEAADYSVLYHDQHDYGDAADVFSTAATWLAELHKNGRRTGPKVGCDALRQLNHAHIFSIPLSDPPASDLDAICDGLAAATFRFRTDNKLHKAVEALGKTYLTDQPDADAVLLHGDFYPGSWLHTPQGFRVIDPEFCFCGPREFDLGVMIAHRIFCHTTADVTTIETLCDAYGRDVSVSLVKAYTGTELIRRLLGVAQLPLNADLAQRINWLEFGQELVMEHSV